MALQPLLGGAGLWLPSFAHAGNTSVGSATYVMDADNEKTVLVMRCPKAGNIDRFDFLIGTVTNSPDNGLQACLQGVSLSTGLQDGTILGATNNAQVTYAHTVTTGWKSSNFGEVAAVTRGQLVACVIQWAGAFTASDSVAMSHLAMIGGTVAFPYGLSITGTKNTGNIPIIGLHYTDGYVSVSPNLPAVNAHTALAYNSSTGTADEWGMAFQVPFPCVLDGVGLSGFIAAAGADYELLVYNAADTVLATLTQDGDVSGNAAAGGWFLPIGSALTLTANTLYRVTIRPTTANNVTIAYYSFASAELMRTMEGGEAFYMTSRLNQGGTWTNYNSGTFRRPRIALHLTAFDDSVSAGAGPRARYQMGMA